MAQEQVTQADREAAADLANALEFELAIDGNDLAALRSGTWDNVASSLGALVQAFAAHRLASTTAQAEAAEKMAEAIQWALSQAQGISATTAGAATTHGDESGALGMCNSMAGDIAINLEAALAAWESIKENEHGRCS